MLLEAQLNLIHLQMDTMVLVQIAKHEIHQKMLKN